MKKTLIALSLVLLVWHALFVTTCQAQSRQAEPALQVTPAVTRLLIDSLSASLYRNYIFPDTAQKMTGYVKEEYKKGAYNNITDPRKLAERLQQDLQKAHHDGHFHLQYAPDFARDLLDTTEMVARNRQRDSMELINAQERNFGFHKVEILPGNIGYLLFRGFSGFVNEGRPTVTAALRLLAHTKALIIDLRENGGGSPDMVRQIESYFFPVKTHLNDIVDRSQGKKIEFWTDPAKTDSVLLQMPVYILTSKWTFSGAEDFSYGMQTVKRAMIVGDTTGGGAHPVRPFPVGQGFVASIPFARSLNPYTHTDWEGTGVIPDIPVAGNKALETAEKTIFNEQVQHAANDQEKRKAQWRLNDLLAHQSEITRDATTLSPYTGTYQGGLVFYVSQSALYCKNAERGNQVFKLLPITGDQFVLDENVQVEFVKDKEGHFSGINMLWSEGGVSYKAKEK